jgi:hypothetical protein
MIFCARATRGLKRMGRAPGRPTARGTRTIGMCSFDARNRGSTRLPLKMSGGIGVTRAVEDQSAARSLGTLRASVSSAVVTPEHALRRLGIA